MSELPKNKNLFFLILIFLISIQFASAQNEALQTPIKLPAKKIKRFIFSAGIGSQYSDNNRAAFSAILFPRFNLVNGYSDFSLSLGVPASVGYATGGTEVLFAEIPVLFELNLGNQATKNFYNRTGFAFGVGYNYFFLDGDLHSGTSASVSFRWWMLGQMFSWRNSVTFANDRQVSVLLGSGLTVAIGKWVATNKKLNRLSRFAAPFKK